jgi:Holliday junction resolvase RusA-like endonuclease
VSVAATIDRPFALPPDATESVFDIPLPPSVNRTRRVNWKGHKKYTAWKRRAGFHLMVNGQLRKAARDLQRYELTITLDREQCRQDPDNPVKAACDLLRELQIIVDDSPRHAERILIVWGTAPDGCRLTVRSVHA